MRRMKPDETARMIMFVVPTARLAGSTAEQRESLVANFSGRAQVKNWALTLHDRDDPTTGGSGASGPHWQGLLRTSKDLSASRFESWIPGCEPVRKVEGGHDGLLDGVVYLTHENQPEKARYPRSTIHSSPGWDWEAELRAREIKSATHGGGKGRTKVMAAVLDGDMTVMEARRRGISNERALRTARHQYLAGLGTESLPAIRVNFYLQLPSTQHPSGVRLAEALARTLSHDQRFFYLNSHANSEYDGEHVLLTSSDLRPWQNHTYGHDSAWDLPGPLGGAHELLAILGATPRPHTIGTELGPTQLIHRHTVIVGTEPFNRFRAELECAYRHAIADDAREQSFLSLPVFVPVTADEFAVQVSTRFVLGRGELDQLLQVEQVRLQLLEALEQTRRVSPEHRLRVVNQIEQKQTARLRAVAADVAQHMGGNESLSADDLLMEFADLGQGIAQGEGNRVDTAAPPPVTPSGIATDYNNKKLETA